MMICFDSDISSKPLEKHVLPRDAEGQNIEFNFKKKKCLLLGKYYPPSESDQNYFNNLKRSLDTYSIYEKVLLVGKFNAQITNHYLRSFLY